MVDDNPRGSHTFLTRHQIAMHYDESTFDVKKQMSMILRDFEWDIHRMTLTLESH